LRQQSGAATVITSKQVVKGPAVGCSQSSSRKLILRLMFFFLARDFSVLQCHGAYAGCARETVSSNEISRRPFPFSFPRSRMMIFWPSQSLVLDGKLPAAMWTDVIGPYSPAVAESKKKDGFGIVTKCRVCRGNFRPVTSRRFSFHQAQNIVTPGEPWADGFCRNRWFLQQLNNQKQMLKRLSLQTAGQAQKRIVGAEDDLTW